MARALRDSKLDTREARLRLKIRGKPYWRLLEPGLHLGYRRLANRPGSWCLRKYAGHQQYVVDALDAIADDHGDADGVTVLSFAQAQRAVLDRKPKPDGPITVCGAIADYIEFLRHHRKTADDARGRADALILPALGDIIVADLTTERLRRWLNGLASTPRRLRSPKGKAPRHDAASDDPEVLRRRKVTANRVLVTLRAALNLAFREGKVPSDAAWRRVRPFRDVDQTRLRFLDSDECRRLVNAAQGDFRALVQAALLTGCRYGELAALTVGDFHADSGTLLIRTSKSGKPRRVWLADEAQKLFASWCAGRRGGDLILRCNGHRWNKSDQDEPMAEACKRAGIIPAVGFHTLRHTHASHLAMRGTPLAVIAEQLGHADQRMTQRYAHLSASFVGETLRKNALQLGVEPDTTVVPLAARP
jgi:integrase